MKVTIFSVLFSFVPFISQAADKVILDVIAKGVECEINLARGRQSAIDPVEVWKITGRTYSKFAVSIAPSPLYPSDPTRAEVKIHENDYLLSNPLEIKQAIPRGRDSIAIENAIAQIRDSVENGNVVQTIDANFTIQDAELKVDGPWLTIKGKLNNKKLKLTLLVAPGEATPIQFSELDTNLNRQNSKDGIKVNDDGKEKAWATVGLAAGLTMAFLPYDKTYQMGRCQPAAGYYQ